MLYSSLDTFSDVVITCDAFPSSENPQYSLQNPQDPPPSSPEIAVLWLITMHVLVSMPFKSTF